MNNSSNSSLSDEQHESSGAGLLSLVYLVLISAYFCSSIYHPLFYWHLTIGHWVEAQMSLPRYDEWTTAGLGRHWFSASWLFGLLLSLVERLSGDRGLIIFKLFVVFFFCATQQRIFSRYSKSAFFGSLLTTLSTAAVVPSGSFGPGLIGYGLSLIALDITARLLNDRSSQRVVNFALLFLTLSLLANIHISYYAALPVCLAMIVAKENLRAAQRLSLLAITIGTLFVTPYLGTQLPYMVLQIYNALYYTLVLQTNPSTIFYYSFALYLILWSILALVWSRVPLALTKVDIILLLFSAVGSFAALTYLPFGVVVLSRAVAIVWGHATQSLTSLPLRDAVERMRLDLSRLKPVGVVWVCLCLIIVFVVNLLKSPKDMSVLPDTAIDYIVDHDLAEPILHDNFVAPYLIYRFSNARGEPRKRVSFDQRTPAINPAFAKEEFLFSSYGRGWEKFLMTVNPNTVLCRRDEPLFSLLSRDSRWKQVYSEEDSEGKGRRQGVSALAPIWVIFVKDEIDSSADGVSKR